jgi:Helicase conserved C-terminal domain
MICHLNSFRFGDANNRELAGLTGPAVLLENPTRGRVRIAELGRQVLAERPQMINVKFLKRFPAYCEFIGKSEPQEKAEVALGTTTLIEERRTPPGIDRRLLSIAQAGNDRAGTGPAEVVLAVVLRVRGGPVADGDGLRGRDRAWHRHGEVGGRRHRRGDQAGDAASEGINMQESCRWIIHFDIPWLPSKLQQRNGRVSRHGQVREVSVHYFRCDQEEDMDFLFRVAEKVEQVREDLGSVERFLDAAIHRHFQGKRITDEQMTLMLNDEIARSPERRELGQSSGDKIPSLTRRAKELLESTDSRLGISPEALREILVTALQVEGQGALEDIAGNPGFYRLKPPPRWAGMVRQSLTFGARDDRMEIVFDARHVTKQGQGPPVLRVKKHQVLMRLGHPVMRQAMATLSRQLHEPSGNDAIYRWTLAALPRANFEALLVLHYTLTAVNQLREPLHDEVLSIVFRVEADGLVPVEESFGRSILQGELHPIRSPQTHEEWVRTFRSRWLGHKQALESFREQEEDRWLGVLQARATVTLQREIKSAKESYDYRIKELQERTREREINQLAKELVKQRAESEQPYLLEDLREEAKGSEQAILDQIELLKRDVEETRRSLTNERDYRLKLLLPKRFELREVRVLPLAIEYVVPASVEDVRS